MTASDTVIRVDDLDFRCRLDGPVGAPWLVFSNSLMTDLTLWDDQVAALGDRYRILRYDQRGHGGTSVPATPCDFDRLAQDLLALFDAVGIDSAATIGVSMGAVTALRFAAGHPERVRALVLSDGNAATPSGGAALWDERIALAARDGMTALVDPTLSRWFTAASLADDKGARRRVQAMILNTPLAGFVRAARALRAFDFRADLARIGCPSLLIAGAQDGALPMAMRKMAEAIPNARFVQIEAAGHLPNIEQPTDFNRELVRFLDRP